MKRCAEIRLDSWLQSLYRKPLVIRGARHVGKSTLVRQFAAARGLTLHEVDLERHPGMDKVFAGRDLPRILQELQFITGQGPIRGPGGILFLDEIQAAPAAIPMLRDLYEDCPDLPVIAAGSVSR